MPKSKSSEKQAQVSGRRRMRNKPVRTLCKTHISTAEKLIFAGDLEAAQTAVVTAVSALDKAAEKGIIHPNNAARRKSRLMKKLNTAQASSAEKSPAPSQT